MFNFILTKLKEPSTRAGLLGIASMVGLHVAPAEFDAYFTVLISAVFAWETFRKEHLPQ